MPVEVFELAEPDGQVRYGLISGFRRLAAFRALNDTACARYDAIPAFVREPQTIAEAMTAMDEENAIRAEVSPWEHALSPSPPATAASSTPSRPPSTPSRHLRRDKRRRLRAVAYLAEELDGPLTAPETLTLRQLLRLAAAAARGHADRHAPRAGQSSLTQPDAQWRLLLPILAECEDPAPPTRARTPAATAPAACCERPRHRLRIRRERTPTAGASTSPAATPTATLIDHVFDEIERILEPGVRAREPLRPRPTDDRPEGARRLTVRLGPRAAACPRRPQCGPWARLSPVRVDSFRRQ